MNNPFWNGKPWQAFKTFAILFSFTMNLVLLIVLLLLAPQILPLVDNSVKPLVGGLNDSFVQMSSATIDQTIKVDQMMPIKLDVPLETQTSVTITEDVDLNGIKASFVLPDGGGTINGNVFLTLPKDVVLPVKLDLVVPIDEMIRVDLPVHVQIPLNETELGAPFATLEGLFSPLNNVLQGLPGSNDELIGRISSGSADVNDQAATASDSLTAEQTSE